MDYFCIPADIIFSKEHIFDRSFYARDTAAVARELLGKVLISLDKGVFCGGIIVETEAYYGSNDPASHAYNGMTPRSKIMFGLPGTAYVYFCYGNHHLLNMVTEDKGVPGAVLIRAARPVFGIEIMKERRKTSDIYKLAKGPGNLTKAFGINATFNGKDITDVKNCLFVSKISFLKSDIVSYISSVKNCKEDLIKPFMEENISKDIISSSRVGIKHGREALLRYYLKGNRFVSAKHL